MSQGGKAPEGFGYLATELAELEAGARWGVTQLSDVTDNAKAIEKALAHRSARQIASIASRLRAAVEVPLASLLSRRSLTFRPVPTLGWIDDAPGMDRPPRGDQQRLQRPLPIRVICELHLISPHRSMEDARTGRWSLTFGAGTSPTTQQVLAQLASLYGLSVMEAELVHFMEDGFVNQLQVSRSEFLLSRFP
jgi:hypothetical protein